MAGFFKSFFAALLALLVFFAIIFGIGIIVVAVLASGKEAKTGEKAVLVVDLSQHYAEIPPLDPLSSFNPGKNEIPSLYDMIRLIRHAETDANVKGLYLKCESNNNDFASSEELRNAILDFKKQGKFVIAYANLISQSAYYVVSAADKIYCHPKGGVEWHGFAMQMPFIKGALEKLEIEPQIFYAGKFKSATEPLREKQMTEANRLQSTELLHDIYGYFLTGISQARNIDTATLHRYADSSMIHFASSALQYKMVDALKYDDEVKDDIRDKLKADKNAKINFILPSKYAEAVEFKKATGDKIAVIYAEGDILDGTADRGQIGGDTYRNYIRKAREDKSIKAIVIRINSGGGSAMASEVMWREVHLAKKDKPVIVSFGDVAASGGYYMACDADSIFAEPNTITGSIGVFGIIPNLEKFFNNKLGVTFDGVKTSPDANLMTITSPLNPSQKQYIQNEIDTIYHDFKMRVAEGRKKSMEYIDSIAQGRVWSGQRAVQLGLVDRLGGLDHAIASAAAKAKIKDYRLREYPDKQTVIEMIFGEKNEGIKEAAIQKELGAEGYKTYSAIKKLQQFIGKTQARMPFEINIQ